MEQLKSFVDKRYHSLIKLRSNNFETKSMRSGTTKNIPDLHALLQTTNPSVKLNNFQYSFDSNTDSYLDSNSNSTSSQSNQKFEVRHLVNQITIPRIDYQELKEATNDFNPKNSLGKGGFGYVYKGVWKKTPVAIKRLLINEGSSATFEMSIKQILNELKFLNSCRHDNILSIYGYSIGENPCLVYQLMDGGSLHDRLRAKKDSQKLSWSQRFTIAKETARGIQYLHTFQGTKPLIHGDIKPANILLDKCCQPKIGDFGLVREGLNSSIEVSAVYGTRPYLPQEYLISKCLSTKIDTYSFGIVLLEMVTGLKVYDDKRQDKHLIDHVFNSLKTVSLDSLIDKSTNMEPNTLIICEFLIKLGSSCVTKYSRNRPEMVDISTEFDSFYLSEE
uniref:non-specific serine/threonine protein kinase n=1 Tax=Megaselia scalaris TaxID=36166 RepID=T1GI01_MEGSC